MSKDQISKPTGGVMKEFVNKVSDDSIEAISGGKKAKGKLGNHSGYEICPNCRGCFLDCDTWICEACGYNENA